MADYSASGAGVSVNLATGSGTGGDAAGDTLTAVENVTGSGYADTLTGDGNANFLYGAVGNDALYGAAGTDSLYGGDGNDTLSGGSGSDRIDGGAGTDTADYSAATGGVNVNLASGPPLAAMRPAIRWSQSRISSAAARRYVDRHVGCQLPLGRGRGGHISAGDGDDTLAGGAGADTLYGGAQMDYLDYSASARRFRSTLAPGRRFMATLRAMCWPVWTASSERTSTTR